MRYPVIHFQRSCFYMGAVELGEPCFDAAEALPPHLQQLHQDNRKVNNICSKKISAG